MLSLATMAVGGTMAGFSDTETSKDNVFGTASLDLLVAKAGGDYREDQPFGAGLEPVFYIDCAEICETYVTNLLLWNIGSTDGTARLHIRLTEDSADIADTTTLMILYGGSPIFGVPQSLQSLDCITVTLGPLPANEIRQLRLEIHPEVGEDENAVPFELEFSIEFQLVQVGHSYSDTETSTAHLESCGEGCTPGYWKVEHHLDSWIPTGYSPSDTVESVFSEASDYPTITGATLLEALSWPGGDEVEDKARLLVHHAVAALLNAAHPDVNYPMLEGDVIAEVNAALASGDQDTMLDLKDILDDYNKFGCPLD